MLYLFKYCKWDLLSTLFVVRVTTSKTNARLSLVKTCMCARDNISVWCVLPTRWPSLYASTGGGWVCPQLNKFEHVYSDSHQMSVAEGGIGPQIWCMTEGEERVRTKGGGKGRRGELGEGEGEWPIPSRIWCTYLPPQAQTDAFENITVVKKLNVTNELIGWTKLHTQCLVPLSVIAKTDWTRMHSSRNIPIWITFVTIYYHITHPFSTRKQAIWSLRYIWSVLPWARGD